MTDYEDMKADAARNGQVWLDNFASTKYQAGYNAARGEADSVIKNLNDRFLAQTNDLKTLQGSYDILNRLYNSLLEKQKKTIHDWSFDGVPDGILTAGALRKITGATLSANYADSASFKQCEIMTDSDGTRFIRIHLLKGAFGGSNGLVIGLALSQPTAHANIKTKLRFDLNFDAEQGGKLPGLSGNLPDVSWSLPAGGQQDPDHKAVSCRMMYKKLAELISYPYTSQRIPGQTVVYGEDIYWNKSAPFGEWFVTEQDLKLNDVNGRTPVANGSIVGSLNETVYLNKSGYIFRDRPELLWNNVMFSVFPGGNDSTWAPVRDTYIDFARITVEDRA